jgi:flagellar hook-basal body complex protein FliE
MYVRRISMPAMPTVESVFKGKPALGQVPANSSQSFSKVLRDAAGMINQLDQEMLQAQIELINGNARDLHTAVLSVEKSSLALDLVISVRNKALEAYQEIMRMPM